MTHTKKITIGAMLLAISVLLPMLCHYIPITQVGAVLLPMHLPVFLGGLLLGPVYGMVLGILAPLVSMVISGMPTYSRVLFMVVELAMYGLASGIFYSYTSLQTKRYGIYVALFIAMLCGRIAYACMLYIVSMIIQVELGGIATVIASFITGLPGIVIQFLLIPMVVRILERANIIEYHTKHLSIER